MPATSLQNGNNAVVRVVFGLSAKLLCTIALEGADMDVADLKWEVSQASGIPHAEQRLLLRSRVLHNAEVLASIFSETSELPAEVTLVRLDPRFAKQLRDIETGQLHLKDMDEEFRSDRDVVLAAMRRDGGSLQLASDALRNDRDVVLAAVKEKGRSLEHASICLKADKEVVMLAVVRDGLAVQYADMQLQNDLDVVNAAVKQNGFAFELLPLEMRARRDVATVALHHEGEVFQFLSESLKKDKELMLIAVSSSSDAIRWIPSNFRQDIDIIKASISGIRIHAC